ncbi:hypothetical protein [Ruegeria aquimaris]|uniref:Uncharacterized protein n=1 Tax=Ruegeria aquimaris TaxID=2984333 RepID=A0ABT3AMH5_9RHOB|nr:hypothetical protein [Ruegeria sp. XHP0148]MCV2889889.1 hypothetical protein [Ruegeria sp. XHP0148]
MNPELLPVTFTFISVLAISLILLRATCAVAIPFRRWSFDRAKSQRARYLEDLFRTATYRMKLRFLPEIQERSEGIAPERWAFLVMLPRAIPENELAAFGKRAVNRLCREIRVCARLPLPHNIWVLHRLSGGL